MLHAHTQCVQTELVQHKHTKEQLQIVEAEFEAAVKADGEKSDTQRNWGEDILDLVSPRQSLQF